MKKGFTLIELLAVIVILAVIAAIAIPIIINIIEDSKREAAIASANGYVRAVNYKIAQEVLNNREVDETIDYVIGENELAVTGNNMDTITGSYALSNSRVLWAGLCINGYSIDYNATTGHTGLSQTNYCNGDTFVFEEPEAESMSVACTNSSKYDSETYFKIKTVEDLACLSNLANSGKNFSGKTIYLLADIDIESDSSYSNPSTTAYGDINGNGTTEGLKVELTTGAGFRPIGNNSTKFSGTFDGYAFTIDHLMINRTTYYAGLFGYNAGTIKGIKLRNISISAGKQTNSTAESSYTGGLVGYNVGTISSIDVQGSVTATGKEVGGVVGSSTRNVTYTNSKIKSVLFKGTVKAKASVGGIVGSVSGVSSYYHPLEGVVYDSAMIATVNSEPKVGVYYGSAGNYIDKKLRYRNSTLAKDINVSVSTGTLAINGLTLDAVDGALDTYIGGDNDNDGYYFDHDKDGNITLYATARTPIETNKLKGEGTEESPYLIKNAKDWRLASSTAGQNKYYAVTSDIDFATNKFYALGTNENRFIGRINGNMNTISNINVYGIDYVGLFGYNNGGTIEGFRINNLLVNATGYYAGGIVSYNAGTIKGIEIRNLSVSAGNQTNSTAESSYAGGIVGYNVGTVSSVDVQGSLIASGRDVGGIVGSSTRNVTYVNSKIKSALFDGSVKAKAKVGGIVGTISGVDTYHHPLEGTVYDSTIVSTVSSEPKVGVYYGSAGNYIDQKLRYNNSTLAKDINVSVSTGTLAINGLTLDAVDGALDTYIGGDNDLDGYYFDYDESGNFKLLSIAKTPITNTLAGTGTQADPYIIANANDWKMASATVTQGKYYSVVSNIDFATNKFYALGTNENRFNGNINGNMHTISNINVYGINYVGLFGYNNGGTIEGFRINNLLVNATGYYAGGIVSYNAGTIKGIEIRNLSVSAGNQTNSTAESSYAGGIVGYNVGAVSSVDVQGNITASGREIGGIAGSSTRNVTYTSTKLKSVVFKGTAKAKAKVGGIVGSISGVDTYHHVLEGLVYDSTMISTVNSEPKVGVYYGTAGNYIDRNLKYKNTTLAKDTNVAVTISETPLASITASTVDGALDTYINGDDGDGYYFGLCNGNLTLLSTARNPIDNTACPAGVVQEPPVYEEDTSNPTHGGIVYLNPKNISQTCTKANVDSNVNASGTLTGVKDGCMRFYIIGEDSTNYKLLLDHNTSGNVAWATQADFVEAGGDLNEWQTNEGSTSMGPVTANKRLQSDTTGWVGNPRLPSANEIAHIVGIDTALSWDSSKTYTTPVTDPSTQIGSFYLDGSGNSYTGWQTAVASSSNKSSYSWLYNNTYNCKEYGCRIEDGNEYTTGNNGSHEVMGYWTSDARTIDYPWAVTNGGALSANNVTDAFNVGVRPIIEVSKLLVTVH